MVVEDEEEKHVLSVAHEPVGEVDEVEHIP
jgi:hypothetical protein